jgi:hypothetical protein
MNPCSEYTAKSFTLSAGMMTHLFSGDLLEIIIIFLSCSTFPSPFGVVPKSWRFQYHLLAATPQILLITTA